MEEFDGEYFIKTRPYILHRDRVEDIQYRVCLLFAKSSNNKMLQLALGRLMHQLQEERIDSDSLTRRRWMTNGERKVYLEVLSDRGLRLQLKGHPQLSSKANEIK